MVGDWLGTTWTEAGLVVISTIAIYVTIVSIVRVNGLRTFSKMSSFDFAVTVAVGSIMATIAATSASLLDGVIALTVVHVLQKLIARNRFHERVRRTVDNQPMLLLHNGEFLEDSLGETNVTRHDVIAKLRENGVTSIDNVATVVLETTGDISVLHAPDGPPQIDPRLYDDVLGTDRLDAFDSSA
jgi:uncharacterized membrane protein YcaP (DUF421 family)